MESINNSRVNTNELKIGEILEQMSNNKYVKVNSDKYFSPKNPFSPNNQNQGKENITDISMKEEEKSSEKFDISYNKSLPKENFNDDLNIKLINAVTIGDYDCCKILTKEKNFLDFANIKDEYGNTAVNYATSYGHKDILKLLLDNGANPDDKSIKDFINLGNIDPELLKQISKNTIAEDEEEIFDEVVYKPEESMRINKSEELTQYDYGRFSRHEIFLDKDIKNLEEKVTSNTSIEAKIVDSNSSVFTDIDKVDRIMKVKESVKINDFESNFCHNVKLKDISETIKNSHEVINKKPIVEEIKNSHEVINKKPIVEEIKKPTVAKKTKTDNPFAEALRKNFNKNKFSENRKIEKVVIPKREETTVEQMEEILKDFEQYKQKESSYAAINNEFVEQFSNRDVTNLLIDKDKIDTIILEHRIKMLPQLMDKTNFLSMVDKVIRQQVKSIKRKEIENITNELLNTIIFYRDMFKRLLYFNKVYVAPSKIHGNGIFAINKLKRGDIITFYFPYFLEYSYYDETKKEEAFVIVPVCSQRKFDNCIQELDNLRRGTIKVSNNIMMVGDDNYISDSRFLGHMVNDPCDFTSGKVTEAQYEMEIKAKSNASLISYTKDRRFIYLVATKDIEMNAEILVPYGTRYWEI